MHPRALSKIKVTNNIPPIPASSFFLFEQKMLQLGGGNSNIVYFYPYLVKSMEFPGSLNRWLAGGNSNIFGIFIPINGEDEPMLTNIFQLGWNHQPEQFLVKIDNTGFNSLKGKPIGHARMFLVPPISIHINSSMRISALLLPASQRSCHSFHTMRNRNWSPLLSPFRELSQQRGLILSQSKTNTWMPNHIQALFPCHQTKGAMTKKEANNLPTIDVQGR